MLRNKFNAVVNDWQYTQRLAEDGVVVMHDTNVHEGPVGAFEAIDPDTYDKAKFCVSKLEDGSFADWGIAVARRCSADVSDSTSDSTSDSH